MALGNERLPSELGWVRRSDAITLQVSADQSAAIANAAVLTTVDNSTTAAKHRRFIGGLHSGMML